MSEVTILNFFHVKFTVTVSVKSLEHSRELVLLRLGEELTGNKGVGSLLESLVGLEELKVRKGTKGQGFVDSDDGELGNPVMGKSFLGGRAVLLLVGKKLGDKVLGVI